MNKKVVYTVIMGTGDDIKEPRLVTPGWDYLCITDQLQNLETSSVWKFKYIGESDDPKDRSRFYKTIYASSLPHDTVVYIDATYTIVGDLDEFVKGREEGIWLTKHPQRDCVYLESKVVRDKNLDDHNTVLEQMRRYRDEGYPDRAGLWRCGVIIRNNSQTTKEFNESWWKEISEGSWRDQISAPYVDWKMGGVIKDLPHGHVEKYFKPGLHRTQQLNKIVYVSTPAEIPNQPKDAWICIGSIREESAQQATQKYPLVHLIITPQAHIFPRWLWDYLPDVEKMKDWIIIYGGSFALWNKP